MIKQLSEVQHIFAGRAKQEKGMWVKVHLVIKVNVVVFCCQIHLRSGPLPHALFISKASGNIHTNVSIMHIPLPPHHFDFLMSLLQISPQLIKVKQNSHFRSRGGVMWASRKCMESITPLPIDFSLNQMQLKKNTPPHFSPCNRCQDSKRSTHCLAGWVLPSLTSVIHRPAL